MAFFDPYTTMTQLGMMGAPGYSPAMGMGMMSMMPGMSVSLIPDDLLPGVPLVAGWRVEKKLTSILSSLICLEPYLPSTTRFNRPTPINTDVDADTSTRDVVPDMPGSGLAGHGYERTIRGKFPIHSPCFFVS